MCRLYYPVYPESVTAIITFTVLLLNIIFVCFRWCDVLYGAKFAANQFTYYVVKISGSLKHNVSVHYTYFLLNATYHTIYYKFLSIHYFTMESFVNSPYLCLIVVYETVCRLCRGEQCSELFVIFTIFMPYWSHVCKEYISRDRPLQLWRLRGLVISLIVILFVFMPHYILLHSYRIRLLDLFIHILAVYCDWLIRLYRDYADYTDIEKFFMDLMFPD